MNLIHTLQKNCQRLGGKPIFIEGDAATGYNTFYQTVCSVARHLEDQGIGPGDNVLVLMPLSVNLYATLCGVWAVGAAVVIFDPSAGGDHIAACLSALDVSAFVGDKRTLLLKLVSRSIRRIPQQIHVDRLVKLSEDGKDYPITPLPPDAPALITFTSGSTGVPKAIVRTHAFLLHQHAAIVDALPYENTDVDLAVLSVFTLVNMMEGITTVLPRDSLRDIAAVDAGKLVRQITKHGVTRITASPRLMEKLAKWAIRHNVRLETLRYIHIGGGPVFLDLLELVAQVASPDGIRVVYGSTEAEPIAEIDYRAITPRERRNMRNGCGLLVGVPAATVQLKIIDGRPGQMISPSQFEELEVPRGGWGEIAVAGAHVVQGYLDPAQDLFTKIPLGDTVWHRTGDCGRLDEQGKLWLLGRLAQVIPTEQGPIFPFAVESAIRAKYRATSAVIRVDGRVVLAVERNRFFSSIQSEYRNRFALFPVRRIPLDRRHSSKVDYYTLAKLVTKSYR